MATTKWSQELQTQFQGPTREVKVSQGAGSPLSEARANSSPAPPESRGQGDIREAVLAQGKRRLCAPRTKPENTLSPPRGSDHAGLQLLIKGVNVHNEKIHMCWENLSPLFLKFFVGSQTRDFPVMKKNAKQSHYKKIFVKIPSF